MSASSRWKLADHPVVVLVSLAASLVAIIHFLTGITTLREVIPPHEVRAAEEGVADGVDVRFSSKGRPGAGAEESSVDEEMEREAAAGSDLGRTITRYWAFLDAEDFRSAWSVLSPAFQQRNHGSDFEHYRNGQARLSVCSVHAEDLGVHSASKDSGIVSATIVYRAGRSCRTSREQFDFLLAPGPGGEWLIDRVMRR